MHAPLLCAGEKVLIKLHLILSVYHVFYFSFLAFVVNSFLGVRKLLENISPSRNVIKLWEFLIARCAGRNRTSIETVELKAVLMSQVVNI